MFQNLKGKKIIIMGLGINENGTGVSAALFFAKEGARVLVTDLKTEKELKNQLGRLKKFKNIRYIFGRHRESDFTKADFIFKNPSVPKSSLYLKIARENKIPIINDWTIFFEKYPNNLMIGITGTKGKSGIATLIYEVLKNERKDTLLCGNIGVSPLSVFDKIKKNTIIVAELSSWLLAEFETIKKSPQISIITNLMPDHLDKYKNIEEYYKDKENIFKFQNKNDFLILNKNDKNLKSFAKKAKSQIVWFSDKQKYSAAFSVAKILKIPRKSVERIIKNFKGIPHRLEFVREKNGVKYINDSAATMPDAVVYALNSFNQNQVSIILIAGGADKKLDYKNMAKAINKNVKELILFPGTATDELLKHRLNVHHSVVYKMKKAVEEARKVAKKGDIVLLSPGAASFGLFCNEFDRGDQFKKYVKKL